eukprot:scaffold365377_cov36-Prasinocladus_malaysianus.AAC.1
MHTTILSASPRAKQCTKQSDISDDMKLLIGRQMAPILSLPCQLALLVCIKSNPQPQKRLHIDHHVTIHTERLEEACDVECCIAPRPVSSLLATDVMRSHHSTWRQHCNRDKNECVTRHVQRKSPKSIVMKNSCKAVLCGQDGNFDRAVQQRADLPLASSREATWMAAQAAAPDEMPTSRPSS